jgi:hypothetical protein
MALKALLDHGILYTTRLALFLGVASRRGMPLGFETLLLRSSVMKGMPRLCQSTRCFVSSTSRLRDEADLCRET